MFTFPACMSLSVLCAGPRLYFCAPRVPCCLLLPGKVNKDLVERSPNLVHEVDQIFWWPSWRLTFSLCRRRNSWTGLTRKGIEGGGLYPGPNRLTRCLNTDIWTDGRQHAPRQEYLFLWPWWPSPAEFKSQRGLSCPHIFYSVLLGLSLVFFEGVFITERFLCSAWWLQRHNGGGAILKSR